MVGLISWWYGDGWKNRVSRLFFEIRKTFDFFSIQQMIATLVDPYRQISANQISGSFNVVIQSFFDRLLSRAIGFIMRSFLIIAGLLTIVLQAVFISVLIVIWPLIPLLPFAGLILWVLGAMV